MNQEDEDKNPLWWWNYFMIWGMAKDIDRITKGLDDALRSLGKPKESEGEDDPKK